MTESIESACYAGVMKIKNEKYYIHPILQDITPDIIVIIKSMSRIFSRNIYLK